MVGAEVYVVSKCHRMRERPHIVVIALVRAESVVGMSDFCKISFLVQVAKRRIVVCQAGCPYSFVGLEFERGIVRHLALEGCRIV